MDIDNIQIRASGNYPNIENANNDTRVVMLLKDLLASRNGEASGVMQYFFQSRIARQVDDEIADILEEISIVEMEHMQLLMDAIVAFGGVPKYENSKGQPFSANYINYSTKLKDMLQFNILDEQNAIRDYNNAQQFIDNQSLKNLLARIVEDEKLHLNIFKNLQNTVSFLSI